MIFYYLFPPISTHFISITPLLLQHNVTTDLLYSTPLFCNLCSKPNQCANLPATTEDPGHHMWYVKTFCTHKDLGKFTVYFPYILLISALLLMSIERLINKIFKSKEQIEGFHSLLTQKNDNETVRAVSYY